MLIAHVTPLTGPESPDRRPVDAPNWLPPLVAGGLALATAGDPGWPGQGPSLCGAKLVLAHRGHL